MRTEVSAAMERLLPEGGLVTCALSGGADSVALLHVLRALSPELGITLRAAHFNHQLIPVNPDGPGQNEAE